MDENKKKERLLEEIYAPTLIFRLPKFYETKTPKKPSVGWNFFPKFLKKVSYDPISEVKLANTTSRTIEFPAESSFVYRSEKAS